MEDPKGGIKTRSQAVEASNKRLLLIFPFRLSIDLEMHVSCPWFKKRKTVFYGPIGHGYLYKQVLFIIPKWWWYCCYVGAILPGWEPRVASGEDKEVSWAISLGGMKDKVKIPTSTWFLVLIMMNHQWWWWNHHLITSLLPYHPSIVSMVVVTPSSLA